MRERPQTFQQGEDGESDDGVVMQADGCEQAERDPRRARRPDAVRTVDPENQRAREQRRQQRISARLNGVIEQGGVECERECERATDEAEG